MIALFQWLREQRRGIALLIVALCGLGGLAAWQLPAAILPEITFPRVKVIAGGGERPGDDMMRAVTRPIEEVLRRVPGVLEIRSTTSRGSTEINLDCTWASNMDLTLQRVQGQIEAVRTRLPAGTQVDVRLMNTALFPVLGYSLTSDRRSLAQLRDLALTRLQPELSRLPGVSEVVVQGGRRLEARVTLDPALLQARGLDPAAVADALRGVSELQSVGLIDANRELYLGLVDARPVDLATLGALPIPVTGAAPVPLATLGVSRVRALSSARPRGSAHQRASAAFGEHNHPRRRGAELVTVASRRDSGRRSRRDVLRPIESHPRLRGQRAG
ncbi:MAG: efflux RND transporter permease subunit [Candidatus Eisenbacteria bacterium]|uniref:Efflux RND transporter permease subunit n=1 Tax=Eiseniibacteriota bacterium TaxID=2212470 RepID=A0A538TN74_UNCEI|nr:MAG: efflux RND transporter permease subunit [Candidatus Eisenbacteria bacterium]